MLEFSSSIEHFVHLRWLDCFSIACTSAFTSETFDSHRWCIKFCNPQRAIVPLECTDTKLNRCRCAILWCVYDIRHYAWPIRMKLCEIWRPLIVLKLRNAPEEETRKKWIAAFRRRYVQSRVTVKQTSKIICGFGVTSCLQNHFYSPFIRGSRDIDKEGTFEINDHWKVTVPIGNSSSSVQFDVICNSARIWWPSTVLQSETLIEL